MADMISASVQRDIEDIGKSINTDAIITPRVGEPFESIPMVSRTALPRITNLEQEKANKVEVASALSEKVNTDEVYLKSQSYSSSIVDQKIQTSELNLQTQIAAVGTGNKAYKTYVDMDADKANIAAKSKVTVTNDATSANNGDWQWDGSVFTKSIYDPLAQAKVDATTKANAAETNAKEFADDISTEKVKEVAVITNSKAFLHGYKDGEGNIYAYYDNSGNLVIAGLNQSVQEEIIQVKTKAAMISIEPKATDLIHFTDEDKNLVAKIDENGKLWLTGLNQSVQAYLNGQQSLDYSNPKSFKTKANLYSVDVSSALQSNTEKAPIGRGLLQQQYHLGKNWINNLSMQVSTNRIIIGAFNDSGTATQWVADSGVVHPNVIKFDEPVCGFKYWMGINPYTDTNENYELPYIYGSNSDALDDWTLISDFAQPFDVDPPNTGGAMSGHLSDSAFTYDPINGELWFFWRQTLYFDAGRTRENAKQTFFGRKTKDGQTWSEKLIIYPQYTINNDTRYSPAIVFNAKDGLFYLYYITFSGALGCETSESLTNPSWKKVADIQLPVVGWHLEMKWLGDALVALVHSDTIDQLYVGISRDMKTFEWGGGLFNAATNLYKSSFIPVFNDNNEISLKIVYTTDQNSTPKWQLHTTQTNFTSIKD